MDYISAKYDMLDKLRSELPAELHYHGIHHTLEVLSNTERLIISERVSDDTAVLLRIAAVYHDSGFVKTRVGHEQVGCEYARRYLPEYGLSDDQVEQVCGMILATRVPQAPTTPAQAILCDADLDYLGRDDFWSIGRSLYKELAAHQLVDSLTTWNGVQLQFLQQHRFHTATNRREREPQKQMHLSALHQMVGVE